MKLTFKAISIALIMAFALALLSAFALAAPSPSPGTGGDSIETSPTPTPTPTPTPGGKTIPGDGKRPGKKPPGDDGDGPGSGGDDGDQKPPTTAPPKKDTPPDENNIPWEIEPDSEGNAVRAKKSKIKKMTAVWTIRASGKLDIIYPLGMRPLTHHDIKFEATKQGGNTMLGTYTGKGSYWYEVDRSSYMSLDPYCTDYGCELNGPLTNVKFTLVKPEEPESEELAPLVPPEEELAPLVPPEPELAPLIPTIPGAARANGAARWAYQWIKDFAVFEDGKRYEGQTSASDQFNYEILAGDSGDVLLFINAPPFSMFFIRGRVSKTMKLVDVK